MRKFLELFKRLGAYKDSILVTIWIIVGVVAATTLILYLFGIDISKDTPKPIKSIMLLQSPQPSSVKVETNIEVDMQKFIRDILAGIKNQGLQNELRKIMSDITNEAIAQYSQSAFEFDNFNNYVHRLSGHFDSKIALMSSHIAELNREIYKLEADKRSYEDGINKAESAKIPLQTQLTQYEKQIANEQENNNLLKSGATTLSNVVLAAVTLGSYQVKTSEEKISDINSQVEQINAKLGEQEQLVKGYLAQIEKINEDIAQKRNWIGSETNVVTQIGEAKYRLINTTPDVFKKNYIQQNNAT